MPYSGRHLVNCNRKGRVLLNIDFTGEAPIDNTTICGKVLQIQITDEKDLYFLFTCRINVEDFNRIKIQQGLLVDFHGFEHKVVELLKICSEEENNETPKYMLTFSNPAHDGSSDCTLQIVETTNFKHLVHLSLNFNPCNDGMLIKHLMNRLHHLENESNMITSKLKAELYTVTSTLSETEEKSKRLHEELGRITLDSSVKLKASEDMFHKELEDLKTKHIKEIEQIKVAVDQEKCALNQLHLQTRKDFENRLEDSLCNNKELENQKAKLEKELTVIKYELELSQDQNSGYKKEISDLIKQLETQHQNDQSQTNIITNLQSRICTLENNLDSRSKLMSEIQETLAKERECRSRCEIELQQRNQDVERLEKSLATNTQETNKADEIIKRLQNDLKSLRTKAKLRGEVATEQERLLCNKETEIKKLTATNKQLEADLDQLKSQFNNLNEQFKQKSTDLKDAQKTIKTNEAIIAWLNRQITENEIGQVQSRLKSSGFQNLIGSWSSPKSQSPSPYPHSLNPNSDCITSTDKNENNNTMSNNILTNQVKSIPVQSRSQRLTVYKSPLPLSVPHSTVETTSITNIISDSSSTITRPITTESNKENPVDMYPYRSADKYNSKLPNLTNKGLSYAEVPVSVGFGTVTIAPFRSSATDSHNSIPIGKSTINDLNLIQSAQHIPTVFSDTQTLRTVGGISSENPYSSRNLTKPPFTLLDGEKNNSDSDYNSIHQQSLTSAYFPQITK